MHNMLPLVSVILPNFNHGKYLANCISRILNQTYANLELVIVDDGSKDESWRIIQDFVSSDSRVRAYRHDKNLGALAASELALSCVNGSFLYQAASDDFLIDDSFFADAINAFSGFPHVGLIYGRCFVIDAVSQAIIRGMGHGSQGYIRASEFVNGFLNLDAPFFVPAASCLVKMSDFKKINGYDYQLGPQVDYFVNHAIPFKTGAVFLDKPISAVRAFADKSNFSSQVSATQELQRFRACALRMMETSLEYSSAEQWELWWRNRYARLIQKHFPFHPLSH